MTLKHRLSVSVDEAAVAAGHEAVAAGAAPNLSAWVNEALLRQAAHDRRARAIDEYLEDHEQEFGAITDEELRVASSRLRDRAIRVRHGDTIYPSFGPRHSS